MFGETLMSIEPRSAHSDRSDDARPVVSRRAFVQGALAGGIAATAAPAVLRADETADAPVVSTKPAKRVIYVFMSGAPSQFETFDPKPGTPTGGAFGTIGTATPGVRFCEYLPRLAEMSGQFAVIRSVTSGGDSGDHNREIRYALTGHAGIRSRFGVVRPSFGSIVARTFQAPEARLPGYVCLSPSWHDVAFQGAGCLESRFDIMKCPGHGRLPGVLKLPEQVTAEADQARNALRKKLAREFLAGRRGSRVDQYETSFERAQALMESSGVFDLSEEPVSIRERYGPSRYGRDALTARRMIEAGIPFVLIQCFGTRCDWDWHYEAFSATSKYMLSVFDQVTTTLIQDLKDRGLWDETLLICAGEFGRTPEIGSNQAGGWGGRAHYGRNFATMLGGGPIHGGQIVGSTNSHGTDITDRKVSVADVHRTYYAALGINPDDEFIINGQPVPYQEEGKQTIEELLV